MKFLMYELETWRREITGKSCSNKKVKCYWCGIGISRQNDHYELCLGDDGMTYCVPCAKRMQGKIEIINTSNYISINYDKEL